MRQCSSLDRTPSSSSSKMTFRKVSKPRIASNCSMKTLCGKTCVCKSMRLNARRGPDRGNASVFRTGSLRFERNHVVHRSREPGARSRFSAPIDGALRRAEERSARGSPETGDWYRCPVAIGPPDRCLLPRSGRPECRGSTANHRRPARSSHDISGRCMTSTRPPGPRERVIIRSTARRRWQ